MDDQFYSQFPFGSTRLATEEQAQPLTHGLGVAACIGNSVIRLPEQEPTLIIGGAGCGKGSQLGLYQPVHPSTDSFFMLDMGGQYMSVTWHWNLAESRHAYAINPYECSAYPELNHPFHLFGVLKEDKYLFDNAKRVAGMALSDKDDKGDNAWVGQSGRRWLSRWLILLVLVDGRVTPKTLWQFINEIDSNDEALKQWGQGSENLPYDVYSTLVEIFAKKHGSEKEYGAIMGKIKDDLDWIASPQVAESVSGEEDILAHLADPNKKVGIYYVIPGGSGKHNESLTRMVVGIAQLHCVRSGNGHRPLFYLEESATCGSAHFIRLAVSEFRKYFRVVLVYQSQGQLEFYFGKEGAQEIKDSCGMQLYLGGGIRDFGSAKLLADTVGKTTIEVDDPMAQGDRVFKAEKARLAALLEGADPLDIEFINAHETSQSIQQRKSGRYVLDPAELMRLKDQVLVVTPGSGVSPVLAEKLPSYWENPAMAGRCGPDPLFPPMDKVVIRHSFWGKRTRRFIRECVPEHLSHLPNHSHGRIAYVKGYKTF